MRKIVPVAVLGAAGFFGVPACTAVVPAIAVAPPPTRFFSLPPMAPTDNSRVARYIAGIAVGENGLTALHDGNGHAVSATCDPGTVSHPPRANASTSASCGINYSNGSVWKQTVTVTFDGDDNPIADFANLGIEVLPPTAG